jgi:LysM repeat protein
MAGGAAAQSTPEEPFAVLSRGRPLPHAERTVVVLPDTAPPAPPADSARRPATRGTAATTTPPPTSGATRAAANPPAPSPRTTPAPRTHTVAWGDTWYEIALKYDVSSSSLRAANPDVDPERLRSGTVLRIPSGPGSARAAAPTTSTNGRSASAPERRTHKVEAGESLWGIARRYGVSTAAIREANDLDDDRVRIGETLVIPAED